MASPAPRPVRRPGLLSEVWWILTVDLRREGRRLAVSGAAVLLALAVVLGCALAGLSTPRDSLATAALWVAVVFVGVQAASTTYEGEQRAGTLTALLCGPVRPTALYLGKTAGILLTSWFGALAAAVAVSLLIHSAALYHHPVRFLGIVLVGATGFAIVGGLVGPLLGLGGGREALLALLLLPLGVPLVVSCARATRALFSAPAALDVYRDGLGLAVGLDLFFLLGSLWLFEPLVRRSN